MDCCSEKNKTLAIFWNKRPQKLNFDFLWSKKAYLSLQKDFSEIILNMNDFTASFFGQHLDLIDHKGRLCYSPPFCVLDKKRRKNGRHSKKWEKLLCNAPVAKLAWTKNLKKIHKGELLSPNQHAKFQIDQTLSSIKRNGLIHSIRWEILGHIDQENVIFRKQKTYLKHMSHMKQRISRNFYLISFSLNGFVLEIIDCFLI